MHLSIRIWQGYIMSPLPLPHKFLHPSMLPTAMSCPFEPGHACRLCQPSDVTCGRRWHPEAWTPTSRYWNILQEMTRPSSRILRSEEWMTELSSGVTVVENSNMLWALVTCLYVVNFFLKTQNLHRNSAETLPWWSKLRLLCYSSHIWHQFSSRWSEESQDCLLSSSLSPPSSSLAPPPSLQDRWAMFLVSLFLEH